MSFTRCIQDYIRHIRENKELSPSTVENYDYELRRLQDFFAQKGTPLVPGKVTSRHIGQYLGWLKEERGYKPASIKRVTSVIRSFFNYLIWTGGEGVRENPTLTLPSVKIQKKLPQVLSAAESRQFITGIKKVSSFPSRDYAMFLLFLHACCRLQELQQLKLDSIHLQEGYLEIGELSRTRRVPLSPEACRALSEYMEIRRHQGGTDALFLTPQGKPVTKSGISCLFKSLARKTGVYKPGLSVQKLRHTGLALKLQEGLDMGELQEFAGHASSSTTHIYRRVVEMQKSRQYSASVGEGR